ncbi:MAG: carboxymuconolactone decarboxylase family protein [Lentisphaerota bacterium]
MASVKLYKKTGDKKAVTIQTSLENNFGFVPEVFQAMGRSGEFLDNILKLADAAGKNLDPKTKELIAIAVSAVNGCQYCVEAHRAMALKAGVKEEEITGALEVAAMMSAYNNFNKAIGLKCDIKAKK